MKLIIISVFCLLASSYLIAQQAGPPLKRDEMIKDLKTKLQLTNEQVKKVESIFENNKKKMDSMFEKSKGNHVDMRSVMDSLRNSTNKQIEKILTEKQKEKFKKMMEDQHKGMGKMPPPPPRQ